MKKLVSKILIAIFMTGFLPVQSLWAAEDVGAIEQRLNDLEQQVAILKRQLENSKEEAKTKSTESPVITANAKDGFSIKSPNDDYKLKIGGYVQADSRQFGDSQNKLKYTSSFLARRVRLIIQGNIAHDFGYFVQPDFGYNNAFSSITAASPTYSVALQDAWVDYHYFSWATIRGGKFKTPFDIENLQDTKYTNFAELGLTGNLSPQRDVGFQVSGNLFNDRLNYAVGIFGGAADHENFYGGSTTSSSFGNNKNGVGRIFIQPFKDTSWTLVNGFGIGYASSFGKQYGSDLPTFVTPGQAPVFNYNTPVIAHGAQLRGSPQFYYYYKSFGTIGEFVDSEETLQYVNASNKIIKDKIDNKAWQLSSTYVLTGEDASYNGVTPRHNFDPFKGQWGAVELAGRYGQLSVDKKVFRDGFASLSTSIQSARSWATGVNWYLNRNVKLVFDYEKTQFKRGAAVGNRKAENLFTGRFQIGF